MTREYKAVRFFQANQVDDKDGQPDVEDLHGGEVFRVSIPDDISVAEDVDQEEHLLRSVGDFSV